MKAEHAFEKWKICTAHELAQCTGKFVAVTFSGGRDSSVCLHLLNRVKNEFSFELSAYLMVFPRHRYPENFIRTLKKYWGDRGIHVETRTPPEDDSVLRASDNPCRTCQDLRKRELPSIFELVGKPPKHVVIVSGHSLWDLAGYALHRFSAQALAESTTQAEAYSKERFDEISQRFYTFLTMPEGYSVYRPLLYMNKPEIDLIVEDRALPVVPVPCTYTNLRPKKALSAYFSRFGFSFSYTNMLEFATTYLHIGSPSELQNVPQEEYLKRRF